MIELRKHSCQRAVSLHAVKAWSCVDPESELPMQGQWTQTRALVSPSCRKNTAQFKYVSQSEKFESNEAAEGVLGRFVCLPRANTAADPCFAFHALQKSPTQYQRNRGSSPTLAHPGCSSDVV